MLNGWFNSGYLQTPIEAGAIAESGFMGMLRSPNARDCLVLGNWRASAFKDC